MDIQINGQKIELAPLKWNDIAKMEAKFGFIDLQPGKSMVQAGFALWLSVQRAGFKDISEDQLVNEIEQEQIPEILLFLFPEKREADKIPQHESLLYYFVHRFGWSKSQLEEFTFQELLELKGMDDDAAARSKALQILAERKQELEKKNG